MRQAKAPRAKPRTWRGAALAEELPVARVLVDKGVLHLDRYFDYAVPEELDAEAQPGVRVRVRFGAGRHRVRDGRREGGGLIDGFLVERLAESDYSGPLAALAQVVSPEPVLEPGAAGAVPGPSPTGTRGASPMCCSWPCRRGTPAPREAARPSRCPPPAAPDAGHLGAVRAGARLPARRSPRAARPAPCGPRCPGPHWPEELARAVGRDARLRAAARSSSCRTGGPPRGSTPR